MRIINEAIFNNVSDAGSAFSNVVDISSMQVLSIITTFQDSSAAGSLQIQVSNNPSKPGPGDSSWANPPETTALKSVTGGQTTLVCINTASSYMWARLSWTVTTAGTSTMTSFIKGCGF